MGSVTGSAGVEEVLAADGSPLKQRLKKTLHQRKLIAASLVLPLGLFIFVTFMFPILLMLFRSIDNPIVYEGLPNVISELEKWDGKNLPNEDAYSAMVADLAVASDKKTIGRIASRLNFETSGVRSLFTSSARKAKKLTPPFKQALINLNPKWGERETWATVKLIGRPFTTVQYLAAIDMRYDVDGNIVMKNEERQIYLYIFGRTLWISFLVTTLALILGYPVAYLLATLPLKYSNILMIAVLLPFWTSLLVRTTSWIVLLQTNGVINDLLVWTGIINEASRIQMIYNQTGTIIAMTHILLPFMVLPLYSVMKTIPPSYIRAALSLGANPITSFFRVYAPQTVPGIGAGSILVFILSVGYYITPALVGGRTGQMISNFIAFHMQKSLNWGLAAGLGVILLIGVLILYWAYSKIVGVDNMKLG